MTIISLTTIPSRIEHIAPCIDSLLAQGLPVYLWVPKKVKRTGATLKNIPKFLYNKLGLTVTVVKERGSITKLLPALEAGFERIITADDDLIYGTGWAEGLTEWSDAQPHAVISYRGRNFDKSRLYNQSEVIKNRLYHHVELITGVQGALYRRGFFTDSIFSEWERWPLNDDIVISAHLKQRNIEIMVVPFPQGCKVTGIRKVARIDALNTINVKGQMNDRGLAKMFWRTK